MERMIVFVPLELFEERYTTQWYRWFGDALSKAGRRIVEIHGGLMKTEIQDGVFLDVFGTNYFKAGQLQELCQFIEQNRTKPMTVFFLDLWFPGIEMLAYMRDGVGLDLQIKGILHAGTYDPWDFLHQRGMEKWGMYLEQSWLTIFDEIYVATEFHRTLICQKRGYEHFNKIKVTGLPLNPKLFYRKEKKERIVVFPHRLNPEKQPEEFNLLESMYRKEYPDDKVQFVRTKDVATTKEEYYDALAKSKVAFSSALQETFGIAMLEAAALGCYPVLPDRLSYPETFPDDPKYNGIGQAVRMVKEYLDKDESYIYVDRFSDVPEKIVSML